MCLHNNGVGSDRGSSDKAVVLSCNYFGVRLSSAASLHRVSTQKLYLTGSFIGQDIPLTAVVSGITIQGTLLALLLDCSAGSGLFLSAILATQLRPILCWYPGFYPKVLRETLKLQLRASYLILPQGWFWEFRSCGMPRQVAAIYCMPTFRRDVAPSTSRTGKPSGPPHSIMSHKIRILTSRLLKFEHKAPRTLSSNIDHHIAMCRILLPVVTRNRSVQQHSTKVAEHSCQAADS